MAFELYKPDGAKTARGLTAGAAGTLGMYGVYSLYEYLADTWWSEVFPAVGEALGDEFPIDPRAVLCLLIIAGLSYGLWWLCNLPRYVDFLVDTEGELKKVTWPTRPEVIASSTVVVVTTLILAVYLFVVDYLLNVFRMAVYGS